MAVFHFAWKGWHEVLGQCRQAVLGQNSPSVEGVAGEVVRGGVGSSSRSEFPFCRRGGDRRSTG